MAVWNLNKVFAEIKKFSEESDREILNLANWVWEEGMEFSMQQELELSPEAERKIFAILHRLESGEPIQYILGHAWFYGLKMAVNPSVLIPRPETEELVSWILEDNRAPPKSLRILDVGTGSGCIAIALKHVLQDSAKVVALDISVGALEVAKTNAKVLTTDIEFLHVDFLKEDLHQLGTFDIIVSNPPYISKANTGQDVLNALSNEPELALFPEGDDPDHFYKRMASVGLDMLSSGGFCYLEMNEYRAYEIVNCFDQNNWKIVEIRNDMQGKMRMFKIVKSEDKDQAAIRQ